MKHSFASCGLMLRASPFAALQRVGQRLPLGLAALLAGCAAEPGDLTVLEAATPPAPLAPSAPAYGETWAAEYVPRTYDEMVADFDERVRAVLSDEELAVIEDTIAARGMDPAQVTIAGRMILDDDMYISGDDILATATEALEKGTTWAVQVDSVINEGLTLPPFTRMTGANFEARKPYFGFGNAIKLIVPNTTVRDIMQLAVNAVTGAADDCIGSTNIGVMLRSDWDALQIGQRQYIGVTVRHGTRQTVCPFADSAAGCADLPTVQSVFVSAQSEQMRMVPGRAIGLVSSFVTSSTDPTSVAIATHELLHVLGVGHSYVDNLNQINQFLTIPGSAGMFSQFSVMRKLGLGTVSHLPCTSPVCVNSNAMSDDDKFTLDTLYSARPGSSCSPLNYETTCPQACVRLAETGVNSSGNTIVRRQMAGDCCWCNGSLRTYTKATWSVNTYLCNGANPTPATPL